VERVTYILGAGFSAPLGLPVMRDFVIKSKDLYFSEPEKYQHFMAVFDMIEKLAVIKNYYDADLFNIEEILSIIEMGNFLEGTKLKDEFIRYISDVISHYTPPIGPFPKPLPANWHHSAFGDNKLYSYYGYFVASLFNLQIRKIDIDDAGRKLSKLSSSDCESGFTNYAVVTLNYDMVLENICLLMKANYENSSDISFGTPDYHTNSRYPYLAKLHGSVDTDLIVPPTWAKGTMIEITPIWKHAYQVLHDSNHILVIGYSLPIADSYIKYLIKSAVVKSKHLKSFDVICMDLDGSVKRRYQDFIKFAYWRFASSDTLNYLRMLHDITIDKSPNVMSGQPFRMNMLDQVHESFMLKYS
jgi:hypothetical protein